MPRRLRVVYSSSDDEMDLHTPSPNPNPIPDLELVTLNSSSTPTATATASDAVAPVVISDEEFVDVSDNLSPPSPPSVTVTSDCPVDEWLKKLGLSLRREWLDSCLLGLQSRVSGFTGFDTETKAKLCFGQVLVSDFNFIGSGVLPNKISGLHLVDLPGPFVLQVDEVINISCPLKERYKNARQGIKRCLKLSMTDGVQRVFGMEYRPIPHKILEEIGPAGFKVVVRNVHVRHGLLMLVPEVIQILGGSVEELEMARRRLVQEINKPPRGKRTRTGVLPPLSTRATHAAWPANNNSTDVVPLHSTNPRAENARNLTHQAATQLHSSVQGADTIRGNIQTPPSARESTQFYTVVQTDQHSISRESAPLSTSRVASQSTVIGVDTINENMPTLPTERGSNEISTEGQTDLHYVTRESAQPCTGRDATQDSTSADFPRRESTELSSFSTTAIQIEDVDMDDHLEHPFTLCEGKELPFTYLGSLSAKWAIVQGSIPSIQGKIKCIVTGVKVFKYKERSTFELLVYVDDGSLISEIMIHHNVVQKRLDYSPEEVCTALSSSDQKIVADVKGSLKRFEGFLTNFEGIMLMEMNETSTLPVALEMNQGCPVLDAWLLLQRLKPGSSPSQICHRDQSGVINLSP